MQRPALELTIKASNQTRHDKPGVWRKRPNSPVQDIPSLAWITARATSSR